MTSNHSEEILKGERFEFGANWSKFLDNLNDSQIEEAVKSLKSMLSVDNLVGKKFLDIGSGSGLFSLAARNLGAIVHSIDYDPKSVACTKQLKNKYYPNEKNWIIEENSVLDEGFIKTLDKFDVVYSWGVLHHTGNMKQALNNVMIPVADQGVLFIAIYNDQDFISRMWKKVKKLYCTSQIMKVLILCIYVPIFYTKAILIGLIKNKNPLSVFIEYKKKRGMSIYHDWLDWLGGYPFEVAKPEEIILILKKHGFVLENLVTKNGHGCNQFVFKRVMNSVP